MNSVSSVSCSLYDYKACIFSRSCQAHATLQRLQAWHHPAQTPLCITLSSHQALRTCTSEDQISRLKFTLKEYH